MCVAVMRSAQLRYETIERGWGIINPLMYYMPQLGQTAQIATRGQRNVTCSNENFRKFLSINLRALNIVYTPIAFLCTSILGFKVWFRIVEAFSSIWTCTMRHLSFGFSDTKCRRRMGSSTLTYHSLPLILHTKSLTLRPIDPFTKVTDVLRSLR